MSHLYPNEERRRPINTLLCNQPHASCTVHVYLAVMYYYALIIILYYTLKYIIFGVGIIMALTKLCNNHLWAPTPHPKAIRMFYRLHNQIFTRGWHSLC